MQAPTRTRRVRPAARLPEPEGGAKRGEGEREAKGEEVRLRERWHCFNTGAGMYVCKYILIHACLYIRTYMLMYVSKYIYTHVCMYIHTYTRMYVYTYTRGIHAFMYVYMYACMYVYTYIRM